MLTVSPQFNLLARGYVRPITWQLRASFDKAFDSDTTIFQLDSSLLNGPDLLGLENSDIAVEWDKYNYSDYTRRVISMEVTREEVEPYSIVQSFADIVLNNYDNYFTPNSGSPIDQYILPKRPFRILMGFDNEVVPKFVGLSEKMPELSKSDRTVSFHLIDFLTFVLEKNFPEDILLTDNTISEILDEIFQGIGLLPEQYVLEESEVVVPFFYAAAGESIEEKVKKLMQAELGKLYMDEAGIIRFKNRATISESDIYSFNKGNTVDYGVSTEDNIINHVKITLNVQKVADEKSIGTFNEVTAIPAGQSVNVWVSSANPITGATEPVYSPTAIGSSHYLATSDEAGTTTDTDIVVTNMDVFAAAVKLTFQNTGGSTRYLQSVDVYGTPIETTESILVEDSDPDSIDDFDERLYEFETSYLTDEDTAISKAAVIISEFSTYGSVVEIDVKGNMALQNGDSIYLSLDGYQGSYNISKIVGGVAGGKYYQRIRCKLRDTSPYFVLSSDAEARSLLDSQDYLLP